MRPFTAPSQRLRQSFHNSAPSSCGTSGFGCPHRRRLRPPRLRPHRPPPTPPPTSPVPCPRPTTPTTRPPPTQNAAVSLGSSGPYSCSHCFTSSASVQWPGTTNVQQSGLREHLWPSTALLRPSREPFPSSTVSSSGMWIYGCPNRRHLWPPIHGPHRLPPTPPPIDSLIRAISAICGKPSPSDRRRGSRVQFR